MGATGVGKSTVSVLTLSCYTCSKSFKFINIATENVHTTIGHSLFSCTKDVRAVSYRRPDASGRNYVFLDTPGFDDTHMTDAEVLIAITDWLNAT